MHEYGMACCDESCCGNGGNAQIVNQNEREILNRATMIPAESAPAAYNEPGRHQ